MINSIQNQTRYQQDSGMKSNNNVASSQVAFGLENKKTLKFAMDLYDSLSIPRPGGVLKDEEKNLIAKFYKHAKRLLNKTTPDKHATIKKEIDPKYIQVERISNDSKVQRAWLDGGLIEFDVKDPNNYTTKGNQTRYIMNFNKEGGITDMRKSDTPKINIDPVNGVIVG